MIVKNWFLVFLIITGNGSIYAMFPGAPMVNLNDPMVVLNVVQGFQKMGQAGAKWISEEAERRKRESEQRLANLKRERSEAYAAGQKELGDRIDAQINKERDAALAAAKDLQDVGNGLLKAGVKGVDNFMDVLKEKAVAQEKINLATAEAYQRRKGMAESAKAYIETLTDPQRLKTVITWGTLGAIGIFGAWQGTKLLTDVIKHSYRNPTISNDTTLLSWRQKLTKFVMGIKPPVVKVDDVILHPELASRVAMMAEAVTNNVKNNAFFQNILLYGPPGTGKTMLAKRIAKTAGLDYIYFSASDLEKLALDEALIKISELFEFAKRSSKKLMIIIDEAEGLFANRDNKNVTENTRKMLTHILAYTGEETRDFLLVAMTNRPQDLDKAVLSRFDIREYIGTPAAVERRMILGKYIKEYLVGASIVQKPSGSFISKLFYSPPKAKLLTIQPEAISEENLDAISAKLEGFAGRDISKLVSSIVSAAYTTKDAVVTKEMVDNIVNNKIEQRRQETAGFKSGNIEQVAKAA